jgi:hypothetical protein
MSRNPENQNPRGRNNGDQERSNTDQRRDRVTNSKRYSEGNAREKASERRNSWSSSLSSIDYDRNAE